MDEKLINNKEVGQRIRDEREKLHLSRESFAELIGLSDYYIGQLERGERQMSLTTLLKTAYCLHITLDYLLLGKTSMPNTISESPYEDYEADNNIKSEINRLINKCSKKELELIKKIIKLLLPYLGSSKRTT
jgi:transcriptional regulator with XRE-family HTH domain